MKIKVWLLFFFFVVSLFSHTSNAQVSIFTDSNVFQNAAILDGQFLLGVEDLENNNLPIESTTVGLAEGATLEFGVALLDSMGMGFENGLASPLVQISAVGLGGNGLVLVNEDTTIGSDNGLSLQVPSDSVGPLDFTDSLVIDVESPDALAVGFDLLSSDPFGTGIFNYDLTVFDVEGNSIFQTQLLGLDFEEFVGVFSDGKTSIGEIVVNNLGAGQLAGEIVDNIQVWVQSSFLLGDVNLDGQVTLLDVQPFVDRIAQGEFQEEADTNQDGAVNLLDVNSFVILLTGQ